MACLPEHLRRQVRVGAAEGLGHAFAQDAFLGEAEISEHGVALSVEHHVVWLEVPKDDVLPVELLECEKDLAAVEARFVFVEPLL